MGRSLATSFTSSQPALVSSLSLLAHDPHELRVLLNPVEQQYCLPPHSFTIWELELTTDMLDAAHVLLSIDSGTCRQVQPTDRARAGSIPRKASLERKKSPAKERPADKVKAGSRRRSGDRRPESKAPVKAKTLCRYYARGMCSKGSSCEWSHDFRHRSSPLTEQVSL